jgi:hypothetical protein
MDVETRLKDLLRCIYKTREEEINPVAWDLHMEQVAEMAANGEDIQALLPAIYHYLENSPDCREEFRALVAMIRTEHER